MKPEPRQWPYWVSAVTGLSVCLLVSWISGRREAWDSTLYFTAGIPLMCVVAGLVAYHAPQRVWRWVLAMAAGQALAMAIAGSSLTLWPLALIAMTVLSLPQWIVARLAARFRASRDYPPAA